MWIVNSQLTLELLERKESYFLQISLYWENEDQFQTAYVFPSDI